NRLWRVHRLPRAGAKRAERVISLLRLRAHYRAATGDRLHRQRRATDETTAADGCAEDLELRLIAQELQCRCSLAGDDSAVIERVHDGCLHSRGQLRESGFTCLEGRLADDDIRASAL